MKVDIGNYKSWFGAYHLADKLKVFGVSEDNCDKIGDWLSNTWVHDFFMWVESKRKQKVKVRIDKWDTWSVYHTLSLIILPLLKEYKAKCDGWPSSDELPTFKSWIEVIDKMIWSFEQIIDDDWESQYYSVHPELDLTEHPEDAGERCIPLRWKTEGVYDREGINNHSIKIDEGLALFAKYFRTLWN